MTARNALPAQLTPGTKLTAVWLAVRDNGVQTFDQISARLPEFHNERGSSNIGPLLWTLVQMRVAARLQFGRHVYYCPARAARWFA